MVGPHEREQLELALRASARDAAGGAPIRAEQRTAAQKLADADGGVADTGANETAAERAATDGADGADMASSIVLAAQVVSAVEMDDEAAPGALHGDRC